MAEDNSSVDMKAVSGSTPNEKRVFGDIDGIEGDFLDLNEFDKIKLRYRVKVPVEKYPGFNFPGKILGQKGSTLSSIVQKCRCKRVMLLGKGTIRDKEVEEKRRNSGDAQYTHLNYPMHLLIEIEARPIHAFQSMAKAVELLKTLLEPTKDNQPQQEYEVAEREYSRGRSNGFREYGASAGDYSDIIDSHLDYTENGGYQRGYAVDSYGGGYDESYARSKRSSAPQSGYRVAVRPNSGLQNFSSSRGYSSITRGRAGVAYRGKAVPDSYSGVQGVGERGRHNVRGVSSRGYPVRGAPRSHPYSRGGY